MILHLSGEVGYKMFDKLVKALNELSINDNLAIYFTSEGGLTDSAEAIVDLVNTNSERIGIKFYGEIFSAGMCIFLRTKCQKWCLPDARGMYHFSWQDITINEGGKPMNDYDKFCMSEMRKAKEKTLELLKDTNLTPLEHKKIMQGKDVYFSNDRMLQLINGK